MEIRNFFTLGMVLLVSFMMLGLVAGAGYNIVVPSGSSSSSSSSSSSGGGGAGGGVAGGALYAISEAQFEGGYTRTIVATDRIQFNVGTEAHTFTLDEVSNTTNTIKITVTSSPQTVTMAVGDVRKFELSGDNYYDLSITLNSITGNFADVTIKKISEEVTEEAQVAEQEKEKEASGAAAKGKGEGKSSMWIYLLIAVVLVIIVGGAIARHSRKRENLFI